MTSQSPRRPLLRAEGPWALAANVGLLLAVTIAVNGFLFGIGWARASGRQMPMIPPG